MNKRIKLKKQIVHKSCSQRHCQWYAPIIKEKLFTNCVCGYCRHRNRMDQLVQTRFIEIKEIDFCWFIKDLQKRKIVKGNPKMQDGKCLGVECGKPDNRRPHKNCIKCGWLYKES